MKEKPISKSIVQLRAEKEGNAFMLQRSTASGEAFQASKARQIQPPTAGPAQKEPKTPQLDTSHASRVLSSEGVKETKRKTNYEIFFDIISFRLLNDFSKELAVIRFNNDTLSAIIMSIDKLDPSVAACLAQELTTRVDHLHQSHRRMTSSTIVCNPSTIAPSYT